MKLARRVEALPPYLFAEISKKIAAKRAQGVDIVTFGIGDPDLPTPRHILDALHQAAEDPVNHRYPESEGLPELREAIARYYQRRFEISFDPLKETLPLIGSKEGIGHIALCFIDPGDVALVPDPAYPVYEIGTMFAGGESYRLDLRRENGWLPDLDAIPVDVARKAKVLWLNYPNNPTGAVAPLEFFEKAVAWAKKYDVAILHDNPYCDVAYDGYEPVSIFQVPGAKDVAVEFNSWSKAYNMTGWRIGMVVGNAQMVDALMRVKSNLDSGIPQAIQKMAIAAIDGPQDCIEEHNRIYQRRRDRIVEVLRKCGLEVDLPKASLYVWAKLPEGVTSADYAARLIDETGVVVTPGRGYGLNGEGYIRLSVTTPDDRLEEGMRRLEAWSANQ
ncbi:LL-diaminopimelate aminotransferase [Tepidiforma sp.]|jgi:LL-diaminopimelate aminotransferase|uniref:LL-diaminopimelate aminotransferase n=1 Tax=Tepidiforma sp. TaxID=2682230 RepID=UPI002622B2CF|nr:LL-diaminopimelate aminotransferase [Tepidiforma sp.]MCX7619047.1 LL-diaminopimelate aminotransferase [Tepidiforma sp.]